jgi:hypothetical protein
MPKVNHNRGFKDERDYTVPGGDFANAKRGARQQRKGTKEGVNRVDRSRANQRVKNALVHDECEDLELPVARKRVPKAHDYDGKAVYVRY